MVAKALRAKAVAAALVGLLGGCAAEQAREAWAARSRLVGMTSSDVRMCAGFPAATAPDGDGEIWMFEHGATTPGGIAPPALTVPTLTGVGTIGLSTDGYCRAQMRFASGRVTEVTYAGATSIGAAKDAFCAPIVRNCLSYRSRPVSP